MKNCLICYVVCWEMGGVLFRCFVVWIYWGSEKFIGIRLLVIIVWLLCMVGMKC